MSSIGPLESPSNTTLPPDFLDEKIRLLRALQNAQNDVVQFMGLYDPTVERTLLLNDYAERLHAEGTRLEEINERVTTKLEGLRELLGANETRMDSLEAKIASHGRLIDALVKKLLATPSERA